MLAGFAGRIGLATLLATGTPEQAGIAMSGMSSGQALDELAYGVYGSAPLHVAGMTLMAAGCGRDALLGVGAYGMSQSHKKLLPPDSKRWLDVFSLIERLRADSGEAIPAEMWAAVGSASDNSRQGEVSDAVQNLIRTGHGWGWLL
jgi:hypothetical protein